MLLRNLHQIYQLIDDGNDSKAIKQVYLAAKQGNSYSAILLRLKGDALLRLKRFEDAKTFFKSVSIFKNLLGQKLVVEALIANGIPSTPHA